MIEFFTNFHICEGKLSQVECRDLQKLGEGRLNILKAFQSRTDRVETSTLAFSDLLIF